MTRDHRKCLVVDGEIVEGQATIDQKTITGEGLPVNRGKGEAAPPVGDTLLPASFTMTTFATII